MACYTSANNANAGAYRWLMNTLPPSQICRVTRPLSARVAVLFYCASTSVRDSGAQRAFLCESMRLWGKM